ncbi:hypothetical protein L4A40_27085 [Bacillus cereus]|uniref:hypothetical protein n=1 Tax=Bacillus cereus TaxID=1396 RepID=UPI001F0DA521|nr:hypothetical protein [Bacillus cereus]MCH5476753.1 hypothetical protein [Bacillus cereus]
MKARYFNYFISYTFGDKTGSGNGSIVLKLDRRMNARMLVEARKHIEQVNKFDRVVINNYKLIREHRG